MVSTLRLVGLRGFTMLAILLLLATPGRAQYASGIEGTVVDQSGAVVPGAQCTVTNQDTQVQQTAISDAQGYIRILHLAPGKYRIQIGAPGFEKWEQKDVLVEGGALRAVYPKLKVGQNVATVEVRAETETLETSQGTMSRTLEDQTVAESPLVGQNLYASVASLAPGVTGLDTWQGDTDGVLLCGPVRAGQSLSDGNGRGERAGIRRDFQWPGATAEPGARGDGSSMEFRAEAFNVFNHAQFFGPASVEGNISSGSYGQAVSAMPPRLMQLALRYRF